MMTLHVLNYVANDAESTHQSKNTSSSLFLRVKQWVNWLPSSCLLISSLPGSALRTHFELLGKPRDVNKRFQSLKRKQTLNEHVTFPFLFNVY